MAEALRTISRSPSSSSQSTDITEPSLIGDSQSRKSVTQTSFQRWRPTYHLQAPSGWMNDPCAPHYDATTDLYHISYQSSLDLTNADWGDIAWRSAKSRDLVSWKIDHEPALSPDTTYDGKGIFTGCRVPSQDDSLTYVYTSVSDLPIHHTLTHVRGSESLSMAKSFDGGLTWQKYAGNPILPCEPEGLEVTGWRDPFVSHWPSLSNKLGLDPQKTLFGIISGGIRDVTPTTFLYAIDVENLTEWQYLGPLVDFGPNFRPSKWSGDLGLNWEVTNFLTLEDATDRSVSREVLVMGTEGCLPSAMHPRKIPEDRMAPSRPHRGQLWMSGSLEIPQMADSLASGSVQMQFGFGGHLDHGCLYAANSFFDPKTSKHIVWGWITEEDLCEDLRHQQGWSGMLSLPREIKLQTIQRVVHARRSNLKTITSVETQQATDGTFVVRTLSTEPVQSVVARLRHNAKIRRARLSQPLPRRGSAALAFTSDDIQTSAWELDCAFRVSRRCRQVGVQIVHSRDRAQTTTLSFEPSIEMFTIDRPSFTSEDQRSLINTTAEHAPHTLFTTVDSQGRRNEELLHIRVWRDSSVLEVFVNGRTAISTRIYAAEETFGMLFFADDQAMYNDTSIDGINQSTTGPGNSELIYATLWDGIGASGSL